MMNTLVVYYSKAGSNKFLAEKIATHLKCDIEKIRPRLDNRILMMLGMNLGNLKLRSKVGNYERIILCGPIWMGKFIVPLQNFINKYGDQITQLIFVACCGSTFKGKDEKFGHNLVFNHVKGIMKEKVMHCEAFPIGLVMPDGQKDDPNAFMKAHLNDDNFNGEIAGIFDAFLSKIQNS